MTTTQTQIPNSTMRDRASSLVSVEQIHLRSAELSRLVARASEAPREAEIDTAFLSVFNDLSLGKPFTFVEQHGGELVQDIRPVTRHEDEHSSRGRVHLAFHTDDAFLEQFARPERIALLGVSNPSRISTCILPLDDLLEVLDQQTIDILCQPVFSFTCPASFEVDGRSTLRSPPKPILHTAPDGRMEVAYAARAPTPISEDDEVAHHLTLFTRALKLAPAAQVTLDAGEILILSNSRCLHGRPPVPGERWLKRVYLRSDLTDLDHVAATKLPGVYAVTKAIEYAARESGCATRRRPPTL
jgi:hypothetical protein